jgi:hypothetical protein
MISLYDGENLRCKIEIAIKVAFFIVDLDLELLENLLI